MSTHNKRVKKRGSKDDVWNGRAEKTKGGLVKSDLIENKRGKIVSKRKYERGLKQIQHLIKHNLKRKERRTQHKLDPVSKSQEPVESAVDEIKN